MQSPCICVVLGLAEHTIVDRIKVQATCNASKEISPETHARSLTVRGTVKAALRECRNSTFSSGVEHGNLRELALARMKDLGTVCRDVRTREVGIQEIHNKVRPYEVR